MTKWPHTIPFDLKLKLEELSERRYTESNQDRWAAIKEWLEKHNVEAPERLPTEPGIENHWKWLDDVEQPASPQPFARSPSSLELQERKMIAKTVQEIVRNGMCSSALPGAMKRNFGHLNKEDFVTIFFIVRRSLISLTDVNSVVFGLTTDEVAEWNSNQKSDFAAMSAHEWDKLEPLDPDA